MPIESEYPCKISEVALQLNKINVAAAREKSIRHGNSCTLHLVWTRAVIFSQTVNDPGYQ